MHIFKCYCDICNAEVKEGNLIQLYVNGERKLEIDLCEQHYKLLAPKIEQYIKKWVSYMKHHKEP